MAELKKLSIVRTVTILNKMGKTFKDEMGLPMTYIIEFDDPDDPIITITIDVPEFQGRYKAGIKLAAISDLCTHKDSNSVAEDLITIFLSDMTNMIFKEIFK